MKKICLLLMFAGVFLTSCQKADEYLSADSLKANYQKSGYLLHKPNAEIKGCEIVQINYGIGTGTDVLKFTYNAAGDPVSVTRLNGASTGHPNFEFKYNSKNQLTDFIGPYNSNEYAEFWHKYFYDNKGNIVLDSTYIFPKISNGFPESSYNKQVTYYTYDQQGRIVKDSTPTFNLVHAYSYDVNGNRIGMNYDDKISVYRTNAIWMFLNRDYSVNNSLDATNYNSTGLPLSAPSSDGSFFFLGNNYNNVQFTYDCKGKNLNN